MVFAKFSQEDSAFSFVIQSNIVLYISIALLTMKTKQYLKHVNKKSKMLPLYTKHENQRLGFINPCHAE